MSKNFTKEDRIKKHQTNIKSAQTVLILAGVLGLIHIAQFVFSASNGFYFSFAVPALMFDLLANDSVSSFVAWAVTAVFLILYFVFFILSGKNAKWLCGSLAVYLTNLAFCFYRIFVYYGSSVTEEKYISLAVHIFITVFLVVGIISDKKLSKEN